MLKDITLGQFFPLDSPIHKLDPRLKIMFTLAFIVLVFFADSIPGYLAVMLFLGITVKLSKIKFRIVLKSAKPLLFIIILDRKSVV